MKKYTRKSFYWEPRVKKRHGWAVHYISFQNIKNDKRWNIQFFDGIWFEIENKNILECTYGQALLYKMLQLHLERLPDVSKLWNEYQFFDNQNQNYFLLFPS